MTRSWIGGVVDGQQALLSVDARQLLPADHRVFEVLELVGELDLSAFETAYRADGRGRPPFHPRVMLALILYCRSKRLTSSRDVAGACYDDLGARLITGNRHPDRSTIDRFIDTHTAALKALLPQTLRLGHAEELVDVSVVAGDGTKAMANAAMDATISEADLLEQITDLQQRLHAAETAWLEQVGADITGQQTTLITDTDTDTDTGIRPTGDMSTLGRTVRTLTGMLRRRHAALTHLRTHPDTAVTDWAERLERDQQRVGRWTDRLEQTRAAAAARYERYQTAKATGGKLTSGTPPVPADDNIRVRQARKSLDTAIARAQATTTERPTTGKVNTTDPTSRIMPGKRSAGFDQRHNIQALCCKNQFIIAIGTHDSSNDKRALIDLLRRGRANLDAAAITDPIGKALFDNGYASEDNFTADLPVTLLLVAVEKEARQTGRLHDDTSTAKPAWQTMAERFDDPDNRTLYKRRSAIIEPLFAQLFNRFGRNLNPRGEHVETELHLWAVTHNLLKISRQRHRKHQPS